jgi:NifU-like protein
MQLVEETINDVIRTVLQKDGGQYRADRYRGKRVLLRSRGACAHCLVSDVTLKNHVQDKLREFVRGRYRGDRGELEEAR